MQPEATDLREPPPAVDAVEVQHEVDRAHRLPRDGVGRRARRAPSASSRPVHRRASSRAACPRRRRGRCSARRGARAARRRGTPRGRAGRAAFATPHGAASRDRRPAPSRLACRASSATTCGWSTRSSATSSMSTSRSRRRLAEKRREQRRLARAARAGDEQIRARRDGVPEDRHLRGVEHAGARERGERRNRRPRDADRQQGAAGRDRRQHGVHPDTPAEPHVHERGRFVDVPASAGDEPHGEARTSASSALQAGSR